MKATSLSLILCLVFVALATLAQGQIVDDLKYAFYYISTYTF